MCIYSIDLNHGFPGSLCQTHSLFSTFKGLQISSYTILPCGQMTKQSMIGITVLKPFTNIDRFSVTEQEFRCNKLVTNVVMFTPRL